MDRQLRLTAWNAVMTSRLAHKGASAPFFRQLERRISIDQRLSFILPRHRPAEHRTDLRTSL